MKFINSLKSSLRAKFIIGMGFMLFPLVIVALGSFLSLQTVITAFEEASEEAIQENLPTLQIQPILLQATIPVKNYLIFGNQADREKFVTLSKEVDQAFAIAFNAPFALVEEKDLLQAAHNEWLRSKALSEKLFALTIPIINHQDVLAIKLFDAHIDRALGDLSAIIRYTESEMKEQLTVSHSIKNNTLLAVTLVFIISLIAAVSAALLLTRSVLIPLKALKKGADRFGSGELSYRTKLITSDELGQLTVAFNTMAENLERTQSELKELSIRDSLTGLYNRTEFHRYFNEELERSKRYDCPLSLLMIDIDLFKNVNDTYGHQSGDSILCHITEIFQSSCRTVDHISRYGGEEFAIILPETSGSGAMNIAQRLCELVASTPFRLSPTHTITVTISIGVAVYKTDATTEKDLIAAADQALYHSKQTGRNKVWRYKKPSDEAE